MPDQSERTFLVTGVTSGLGLHTATELAKRNARVILAARTPDKLADTARSIAEQTPGATLEQLRVDLADLSSVRQAGAEAKRFGPIDVLVNNAGVMATPNHRTVDGLDLPDVHLRARPSRPGRRAGGHLQRRHPGHRPVGSDGRAAVPDGRDRGPAGVDVRRSRWQLSEETVGLRWP